MVDEQSASYRLLPWPCVAVVAAHAGVADRGSSQRPGPPGVSVSHNILCRAPPCTCAESAGNPPYPGGERGGTKKCIETKGKVQGEDDGIGDAH